MRSTQKRLFLALAAVLAAASAHGAKWEPVAASKGDRIEIDKMRIVKDAEGRSLAWTRLFLEKDRIDEYGLRYTAIEAYNRYDCEMKSFATLRRVYRRDAQAVREEPVGKPVELPAEPGSIDDKLLLKACKEQTAGKNGRVGGDGAKAVAAANDAAGDKPSAKYADMRSAEGAAKPKTQLVADAPAAAEKPAEARPRFIELPKIDKSQLQETPKPDAKPADAKPAETKPVAAAVEAKPATKPAPVPVERPAAVSRRDYELQLATSGPRKAAKKAAPEPAEAHRHIHWSYEGEGGPANWGKLEPQYSKCSTGQRQSPIDIREGIIKVDLEVIKFDYKPTQFRVTDNGHTIQVDVGDGSSIKVMEREYQLVQFHFHKPSEERINGKPFEMVAHLVHKDYDGRLAVVAVLMDKGSEHPAIQTVWNNIPLERGMSTSPTAVIDLNQLLPDKRAYYTYMGSLTTPPCTEDVLWMVFKTPIQVSPQQIAVFNRLYPNNARPIQPTNGRLVKETR